MLYPYFITFMDTTKKLPAFCRLHLSGVSCTWDPGAARLRSGHRYFTTADVDGMAEQIDEICHLCWGRKERKLEALQAVQQAVAGDAAGEAPAEDLGGVSSAAESSSESSAGEL